MPTNVRRRTPKRDKKVACDLCYTKKIKCDLREPQCSNCTLYKAQCLHSIVRSKRKADRAKPTPSTSPGSDVAQQDLPEPWAFEMHEVDGSQVEVPPNQRNAYVDPSNSVSMNPFEVPRAEQLPSPDILQSDTHERHDSSSLWKFSPIQPSLYYGPSDDELWLPPLERLMPIVENYFKAVNPSAPIFTQVPVTRMITRWFRSDPKRRDKASWAAILVIIALGTQSQTISYNSQGWTDYCMRNAQSAIPELLMRDQDLLGVQTLLGLALLFQNSVDLRSASILAGMAVRLVFRLQMHSMHPNSHFTTDEATERSNVFWVTYMIDKSMSIKMKDPSLISDSDVNIPLPPRLDARAVSIISTRDRQSSFNIFRQRVELAHIEGKAFDLLYSPKSMELDTPAKQARVSSIQKMLDEWYSRIPIAFKLENVTSTVVGHDELIQLNHMYHAYILCLLCANGIWSGEAEWMQRIDSLSRAAIEDVALALQGPKITTCTQHLNPPLAEGWSLCARSSRDYIKLIHGSPKAQCLMWQSQYAYYSAVIVVFANVTMDSEMTRRIRDEDLNLVSTTMDHYNKLVGGARSPLHDSLKLIFDSLRKKATEMELPTSWEEPEQAFETTIPMNVADLGALYNSTPDFTYQDNSLDDFGFMGDFTEQENNSVPSFDPFIAAVE